MSRYGGGRASKLAALAVATLWAHAPLLAQSYRQEQAGEHDFAFEVHRSLERLPRRLDRPNPFLVARFEPVSERYWLGDSSRDRRPWSVEVLAFEKREGQASRLDPKTAGRQGLAQTRAIAIASIRSYHDYIHATSANGQVAEPEEGEARKGKEAHQIWEFDDQTPSDRARNWTRAGVYDLGDREVAIVVTLPVSRKKRQPAATARRYAERITSSGRFLEAREVLRASEEGAKGVGLGDDENVDTPEKLAILRAALAGIEGVDGWDHFTTPNYAVVYSWGGDGRSKQVARQFAKQRIDRLEQVRTLYLERFPPDEDFRAPFAVLRVCHDLDSFQRYSRGAPRGVIGWYSRASRELVVFRERENEISTGSIDDVLYHEGWHQFSQAYFGVPLHAWLEEGFGDYFASFRRSGKRWRFRPLPMRQETMEVLMAKDRWDDLSRFFKEKMFTSGIPYAQAYSVVVFIHEGEKVGRTWDPSWREALDEYLRIVRESRDIDRAHRESFDKLQLGAMTKAWASWARRRYRAPIAPLE